MKDTLRDKANSGDVDSQYELALQYTRGEEREANLRQAAIWFRRAADQDHVLAQAWLAHFYGSGDGLKRNPKKAVKWLRRAADGGLPWAQFQLAIAYWRGWGVNEDDEKAVKWFRAVATREGAASHQRGVAQRYLAIAYENDLGVEKDLEEAVHWFSESAQTGDLEAKFQLFRCYRDGVGVEADRETAFEYLRDAADLGHPGAQLRLGIELLSGGRKTKQETIALNWVKKAAAQGHARAQLCLGKIFTGEYGGHLENPSEAYHWISKAAEQDVPEALGMLGSYLLEGYGVERDEDLAEETLVRAAELGDANAQFRLYSLILDSNESEAIGWLLRAAEQDHPRAMTLAGTMYSVGAIDSDGSILPEPNPSLRDSEKYLDYINRAAHLDEPVAQVFMGLYAKNRNSFGEAAEWFQMAASEDFGFAQAQLAEVYLTRELARQYHGTAIEILEDLAAKGSGFGGRAFAMEGLLFSDGELVAKDSRRSVLCFARAAIRGDAVGSVLLGDACEFGRGILKNPREAARWFRHVSAVSEETGYGDKVLADVERLDGPTFPGIGSLAHVQWLRHGIVEENPAKDLLELLHEAKATDLPLVDYLLGDLLEGSGCDPDVYGAAEAFRRAAVRGHREAQYRLARLLLTQLSIPTESEESILLLEEASNEGLTDATRLLGICFLEGSNVPIDPAQGEELLRRAATRGDSKAQMLLGKGYLEGRGFIQDPPEAYVWLNLAAASGQHDALELRDLVARELSPKDLKKSRSRSTEIYREIIDDRKSASDAYHKMLREAAPTSDDDIDEFSGVFTTL